MVYKKFFMSYGNVLDLYIRFDKIKVNKTFTYEKQNREQILVFKSEHLLESALNYN